MAENRIGFLQFFFVIVVYPKLAEASVTMSQKTRVCLLGHTLGSLG